MMCSNLYIYTHYTYAKFEKVLGRGPLGQKVVKNSFSWHPSGEHLVCSLVERHIGTLPPKKVPMQAKNLPYTEKTGDL